ncbi:MAG: hypothetical protein ACRD23_07890 [Terriglobales bacterium]
MSGQSRGFESGRNSGSFGNHSSNFHSAINDGHWHSFGNTGGSARSSAGRTSGNFAASGLSAHNRGSFDGGWHSFGPSRGASPTDAGRTSRAASTHSGAGFGGSHFGGSTFGSSSFAGSRSAHSTFGSFGNTRLGSNTSLSRSSNFNSFGSYRGLGNRGFSSGLGWRGSRFGGFGQRGYGWGRGYGYGSGYGWGGGFFGTSFGWGGLGFGVGWPYWGSYWGPGWAFGWDPWWYDPYWYSPWPLYNYYQAYPDSVYDNPQPYDPDASYDYDSPSSYFITPSFDPGALHFDVSSGAGLVLNGS